MNEKGIFTQLAAIPILALFLGLGILAGAAALTWDKGMTQSVVGGALAICGGGLAVFATVFGVFVGLAVYRRLLDRAERRDYPPRWDAPAAPVLPGRWQEPQPPALANPEKTGIWAGGGPTVYDLWQQDAPGDAQWTETAGHGGQR